MLVNRGMGGGLNAPGFWLELRDSGAGIVNTTPSLASGTATATFTRATTAWTKLASGLWASVASGQPRSSYFGLNTAVTSYAGYLAEGARTQLVTPTASIRDMTDASWVKVTMTTAKTATGIDGVINSATTLTAAGANSTILQTLVAAATSRTYSCWVKRRTGTGTVLLLHGTINLDITALINSSTYTQVQLNDNELNVAYGIQINTSTDAVDVDFNQFETGPFASTPLDTAAGARNLDVLSYTFAGNANAAAGAVYVECSSLFSGITGVVNPVISFQAALGVIRNQAGTNDTNMLCQDGTTSLAKAGLAQTSTAVRKRIASWGPLGLRLTGDGLAPATAAFDGDIGSTSISIGVDAGNTTGWFGTIKNVQLWKTQPSDGQIVSLTQ